MEFMHPDLLWAGILVAAAMYIRLRRKRPATPMPGISGMKGIPIARTAALPYVLLALGCMMFLVSAARPRAAVDVKNETIMGVDVVLALDVSGSMTAEDFKPNRIEAAKARIREFAGKFTSGRLALVAFAGRSFTQCPLTTDSNILTDLLDQLDVGAVAIDGTAIGDAIINGLNKFTDDTTSRSIILLTDGQNNAGTIDPVDAARAAKSKGVIIYTIGVGTPEGAPIPAIGPMGQKYYLTDPMGNPVLAKVDEPALRRIADITGGEFFRAKDETALKDVYDRINEMEKKKIKVRRTSRYTELSWYPAMAGVFLTFAGGALAAGRYRVLR